MNEDFIFQPFDFLAFCYFSSLIVFYLEILVILQALNIHLYQQNAHDLLFILSAFNHGFYLLLRNFFDNFLFSLVSTPDNESFSLFLMPLFYYLYHYNYREHFLNSTDEGNLDLRLNQSDF